MSTSATHRVENQVPEFTGYNAFANDPLARSVLADAAPWAADRALALGAVAGDADVQEAARQANRHSPDLRTHDRHGHRLDLVEFHPAYHACMALGFGHGVHSLAWTAVEPGAHLARAVLSYLWNQIENGTACPTGMAYAAIPGLRTDGIPDGWVAKTLAQGYDPRHLPLSEKSAATIGYGMTEKHGGSDLRATQTSAVPAGAGGTGEWYLMTGHKWFCSAPMSDGFFTLAQTPRGVSCFFLPRILEGGERNALHFQRLKDKCGNRSNASSEVEFARARGVLVGEEGRGISTILASAHFTRLDFAVGSAGLERHAISLALHHAEHRTAFGVALVEHDSMRRVLADLILDWHGASRLAFRLAACADSDEESERLLLRILTPVAKFWNCKRVTAVVSEALECIGGNGFIEEHPMARLFREAPLNGSWEGTSNMMTMDLDRTLDREPKTFEVVLDEIRLGAGVHPNLDRAIAALGAMAPASGARPNGRAMATLLALAVQASLLCRHADQAVAAAFCATRLGPDLLPGFGVAEFAPSEAAAVLGSFWHR
ncbi:MAG: acyl-CoA dehydrogenase family protein [Sporichthyaceae bacterium]